MRSTGLDKTTGTWTIYAVSAGYCPRCASRLYPGDDPYIKRAGVCSFCVTNDTTPDARFRSAYSAAIAREVTAQNVCRKQAARRCSSLSLGFGERGRMLWE